MSSPNVIIRDVQANNIMEGPAVHQIRPATAPEAREEGQYVQPTVFNFPGTVNMPTPVQDVPQYREYGEGPQGHSTPLDQSLNQVVFACSL